MILSWGKLFAVLIAIRLPTAAWANLTGNHLILRLDHLTIETREHIP